MDASFLTGLMAPPNQHSHFYGVTVGVVTNNQDPDGLGRVKVRFPWLSDEDESHWARVLTPMAGPERGLWLLPEVDDEVLVSFEHGRVEFPYVLGALWNGKDAPPAANDDGKNNLRLLKSRSGHIIQLDDTEGEENITIIDKSGSNSITIDSKENTITITADADVTIQSANGKLILSGKGVEITSQDAIAITASKNLDLTAGPQLNIAGDVVNIN